MSDLAYVLAFMRETEALKGVLRKTSPMGLDRLENAAEHSWQVCLLALSCQEYANQPVDILRVLKMLLVHDLGEIDVGDTIAYARSDAKAERAGIARVLAPMPKEFVDDYLGLWDEFEWGDSADAQYARAIDRVMPILQNIHHGGQAWKQHGVTQEEVFAFNQPRISQGCTALWEAVEVALRDALSDRDDLLADA